MSSRAPAPLRVAVLGSLAAATMALVVVGGATPAVACSCAATSDEHAFVRADAVFVGSLLDVVPPDAGGLMSSADPERFVFEVDEVFKGEITARQSVVTARDGASCGLEITGAGPFLVYAYEEPNLTSEAKAGEVYSNLCSGTRALSSGEIPATFDGEPPIPGGTSADEESSTEAPDGSTDDDGGEIALVLLIGAGVAALLTAAALVAVRARRTRGRHP